VARYLVEHLGFRTIAWEEGWGSGVAIDRYVTSGHGDPTAVVGDALFMLQTEAMLELVGWMRQFSRGRPDHDKVRFLGADVLELRPIQFDEIRRHVADVAPGQREDLEAHLAPIDWRGDPFTQLGWYTQLTAAAQRMVIAHAREVDDLVRALPAGSSAVSRADAVQHAHALLGFYEAYGPDGDADDVRDRYVTAIINRWRDRTGHRYVSIGISFDHGQVLTGWEVQPGGPAVYDVPPPDVSLVDHVLGQAREPDYLIDLRRDGPPPVRRWLEGAARMRIIGSAYFPANDANYAITVDSWRGAFDAILHLDRCLLGARSQQMQQRQSRPLGMVSQLPRWYRRQPDRTRQTERSVVCSTSCQSCRAPGWNTYSSGAWYATSVPSGRPSLPCPRTTWQKATSELACIAKWPPAAISTSWISPKVSRSTTIRRTPSNGLPSYSSNGSQAGDGATCTAVRLASSVNVVTRMVAPLC
jgi:erythromycin esterase